MTATADWCVADGTFAICGTRMVEHSRRSEGVKWCFHCRKRHEFFFVLMVPAAPSYYGPPPPRIEGVKRDCTDLVAVALEGENERLRQLLYEARVLLIDATGPDEQWRQCGPGRGRRGDPRRPPSPCSPRTARISLHSIRGTSRGTHSARRWREAWHAATLHPAAADQQAETP